jgi:hypothetical protein
MPLFVPRSGIGDFFAKFDYLVSCLYAPFEDALLASIFFDFCFLFDVGEDRESGVGSSCGYSFLALFGDILIELLLG